jgi:hypothetical protein
MASARDGVPATSEGDERVPTGDAAVDEVLGRLAAVSDGPLDLQIEVGEQVQRVLQDRLTDLGQE